MEQPYFVLILFTESDCEGSDLNHCVMEVALFSTEEKAREHWKTLPAWLADRAHLQILSHRGGVDLVEPDDG